ncbi:IQ domain-containing protein E-like isoform X2 [Pecten maximus]|uniref:IQ domain-containing protein E-like isoform X2 n=1 Tax=Pecten maximus TaxID=6579 RepID=UPI0014587440|nr:IQ domain-containing protein E-like isoform X2 [Pecten maximus]
MDKKKSKNYYADEYDSADDELLETLIGRNRSSPNKKKQAQNKKNLRSQTPKPKKSATPRNNKKKTRDRAHSCPPGQTGRELWLAAVKNRQTAGLVNSRHPESPRHKTSTEYWVDTLRKTGIGRSTESTGMNTFSGLKKPKERDMPYLSTSSYLRQMVGVEKTKKHDNPTTKPPIGTPAYRTPEEYYEQILELKKQIQNLNQDNGTLKAKVRRAEEDNIKKEKEIDGLLNPTKSEEMRRTLGDKRPDSGAMVHSLKQKILKLETQLRDREGAYAKLQADLKTTKIEEMKVQLEACFHEIVRLQQSKDTGIEKSVKQKNESGKMDKAVKDTIIRLNKQIEQLRSENKGLKQDLERDLASTTGDFEDMDRRQLLSAIKKLEKKSKRRDDDYDDDDDESLYSATSKKEIKKGKIALKGSLEERLDQLDKRETELLDTINKQAETIKRLKVYRRRCEEKDKDIKALEEELGGSGGISSRRSPTPRTRPPSGRRTSMDSTMSDDRRNRKKSTDYSQDSAARKIQKEWKKKQSDREEQEKADYERRLKAAERLQEKHAVRTIEKSWTKYRTTKKQRDDEQAEKIQNFREERAAKKIQREWLVHKKRQYDDELDDATELIQASMRGHKARKGRMKEYDDYYSDEQDYDDAVNLIQSSFKGHVGRKKKLKRLEYEDEDDYEQSYAGRPSSASYRNRPSSLDRMRPGSGERIYPGSGERIRPGSGERTRPGSGSRPGSAISRGSISSKRSFTGSIGRTNGLHQRMSDHEDDRHYTTGRTTPTGRLPYQRASDYDDDDDIEF